MDSEEWHINYNETTDVLSHFSRFPLCDPTDRSRQQLISPTVAPRESHVIESSQFLLNPKRRIRRSCWMVLGEFFRSPSNTIFLSLHKNAQIFVNSLCTCWKESRKCLTETSFNGRRRLVGELYLNIIEALVCCWRFVFQKHLSFLKYFSIFLLCEKLPCHENCMHSIHNTTEATVYMLKR